jgi:type IV pilus assembly protein PilX
MVLVTALLLLVVVTLLAVAMFRSFGLDERIAGNTRDKGRALQAAESAEEYAEWWLTQGNGSTGITCNTVLTVSLAQVCANALPRYPPIPSFTTVPWVIGTTQVGVTYNPPGMNVTTMSAAGTYYSTPMFYITYLGVTPNALGAVYQIDAVGYGGSPNSVAVVEAFYQVVSGVKSAED